MADRGDLPESCEIAIVGGGPSGLSLALELHRLGISDVVVLDRQAQAGGIPRHCGHYPFGFFEYGRMLKGPDYARLLCDRAGAAGIRIFTKTSVTALGKSGALSVSTPQGQKALQAKRVVLAMGARESTRAQRMISGERPQGVISTGALQSMVYEHRKRPFRRPVIMGSELVSFSAIMTCRHLGIHPAAMLEEENRVIAQAPTALFPMLLGIPLHKGVRNMVIHGESTVEAVSFDGKDGKEKTIETDGVIVSGHFRPEAALITDGHLKLDPNTRGPHVDQFGRTSDPAYFSTGNLLRPIETSAWCWTEGREMAHILAADLSGGTPGPGDGPEDVLLEPVHDALKFTVPQRIRLNGQEPGFKSLQIRLSAPVHGTLVISQKDTVLWTQEINSRPERRILVPMTALKTVAPGSPVRLTIEEND